jgi:methionyl aminopeptidase
VTLRYRREIGGPDMGPTAQQSASSRDRIEQIAEAVFPLQILDVRTRTRGAVREIASRITSGMSEDSGRTLAANVLRDAGLRKGWHKILVRFGQNTTKNFEDPSTPGVVLGDDDIFFIDIGPIYEGCEGDAGDTFVVGHDPEMAKAAEDVKSIWTATRDRWLHDSLTGMALYQWAEETAERLGWQLNLELTGHRLSEFPHDAHYDGTLDRVDFRPSDSRWMLEIQIRHPEREFGAFFEDLLLEDDRRQAESLPSSTD